MYLFGIYQNNRYIPFFLRGENTMNKIVEKDNEDISSKIYEVRGVQVMFSSDVALLYRAETKVINQTIKRNIMRFPESFCFQLTKEELDQISLRSQIVTLNSKDNMRGITINICHMF